MYIIKTIIFLLIMITQSYSDTILKDNFQNPEKWTFVSDKVMGGVSSGKVFFNSKDNKNFAYISGNVSTKNNGGFIQFRTKTKLKNTNFEGIKIKVRGNNSEYFIHVRTGTTIFPWDYYASSFTASSQWKVVTLPFSSFKKSSWRLPTKVRSSKIKSIGVVAFGKDFQAEIDLANIKLY